jgi:hypothetical protein
LRSQYALERLHPILEEAQALLDRGFHVLLLGRPGNSRFAMFGI